MDLDNLTETELQTLTFVSIQATQEPVRNIKEIQKAMAHLIYDVFDGHTTPSEAVSLYRELNEDHIRAEMQTQGSGGASTEDDMLRNRVCTFLGTMRELERHGYWDKVRPLLRKGETLTTNHLDDDKRLVFYVDGLNDPPEVLEIYTRKL